MSQEDGSRQNHLKILGNPISMLIKICLIIIALINKSELIIISNSIIINLIKDNLFKEGYYIDKINKYVYLVHPVLYERK